MKLRGVCMAGTGSYVPDRILTNKDLEQMVETSDEWIQTRTGIRERRIARPDEPTSVLAARAAERALDAAGVAPEDLDVIIVGTLTPDRPLPSTACFVQRRLGAAKAMCFDLEAACTGFLYGLEVAGNLIRSGGHRHALVIGAEELSTVTDWTDRSTCVLFGDGAGAMVLTATDVEQDAFLASRLRADGQYADLLHIPAGGSALPSTHDTVEKKLNFIKMTGREVFKLAVGAMAEAGQQVLDEAGLTVNEITWLVPHQANTRIIKAVGKRLGFPDEKVYINVDRYGNTSAATIPVALDEIARSDKIASGDYVLMVAFGGGLTWGASILRWS